MKKFNDISFRPNTLEDFQGQDKVKKALNIYIKAAKVRGDCLDHTIIYGTSGCGKTTLANVIANEMKANLREYSAPAIKKVSDIIDILLNINEGDILFIDEIHRLNSKCEEQLFIAMEQFVVDADSEEGRVDLPHFTLLGATTSHGMLSEPFRNRFQISIELTPYKVDHMTKIVKNSFSRINTEIDDKCAEMIAGRSRGIPRVANGFVRRVKDFAIVLNNGEINESIVEDTFAVLEIDSLGLTKQDHRYLHVLTHEFRGKSVGIDLLAAALNDDKTTLENAVEPYLMQKDLVRRTARGRIATEKAYEIMKDK